MQKVFRVTVDISKKIPAPAFEVNTNDLKSVKLEITITNGQSLLDLTDVTPRINIRKPDNEVIFQDCEIVDAKAGKVQIVLENQAYLVPGTHTAEIACYKGNEITAITGTFSYKSVKGIMNDKAVESKSEFTAIDRKIAEARKLLEDIGENGVGVDEQARQEIQEVAEQLADTVKEVNGVKPTDGKITLPIPQVDTTNLRTKTEKLKLDDMAPEILAAIEGGEGTTFNLLSEPRNGSVTPEKIAGAFFSPNLFDYTRATKWVFLDTNTGLLKSYDRWHTSDYIKVTENETYTANFTRYFAFYNSDKNFISGFSGNSTGTHTVTTPPGTVYVRYSIFVGVNEEYLTNFQTSMFMKGNNLPTSFTPFYFQWKDMKIDETNITPNSKIVTRLPIGFGMIAAPWGYVDFDFVRGKMTLPYGNSGNIFVFYDNKRILIPSNQVNEIDISKVGNKGIVTYDTAQKQFICRAADNVGQFSESEVIIAAFDYRGKVVNIIGLYTVEGKFPLASPVPTLAAEEEGSFELTNPRSDITFIDGNLWAFRASDYGGIAENTGAIYIFNDDFSLNKRLQHNFGHVNTIDYKKETDSIIFGNGSGSYGTDGSIHIIEGVRKWKELTAESFLDIAGITGSRIVNIPVARTFGDKVNVCWGEDNNGQNNICYVMGNDNQNIWKLLLGKGSNNLGGGQFTTGASASQFNGSYKVLGEWTHPKIEVNQGSCYYNGYLWLAIGHHGLMMARYKLKDDGTVDVVIKQEKVFDETGTEIAHASEGVAVKNGMIYHSVFGDIKRIYKYRPF